MCPWSEFGSKDQKPRGDFTARWTGKASGKAQSQVQDAESKLSHTRLVVRTDLCFTKRSLLGNVEGGGYNNTPLLHPRGMAGTESVDIIRAANLAVEICGPMRLFGKGLREKKRVGFVPPRDDSCLPHAHRTFGTTTTTTRGFRGDSQ